MCGRPGLVQILAASAVDASIRREVKELNPQRALIRASGQRQIDEAEFPSCGRGDRREPHAIRLPGELLQAAVSRDQ